MYEPVGMLSGTSTSIDIQLLEEAVHLEDGVAGVKSFWNLVFPFESTKWTKTLLSPSVGPPWKLIE